MDTSGANTVHHLVDFFPFVLDMRYWNKTIEENAQEDKWDEIKAGAQRIVAAAGKYEATMTQDQYLSWATIQGNAKFANPIEHKVVKLQVQDAWKYDIYGLFKKAYPALEHDALHSEPSNSGKYDKISEQVLIVQYSIPLYEIEMDQNLSMEYSESIFKDGLETLTMLHALYCDLFGLMHLPAAPAWVKDLATPELPQRWHEKYILRPLQLWTQPKQLELQEHREYVDGLLRKLWHRTNGLQTTCPQFNDHWGRCRETIAVMGCILDPDYWEDL